MAYAEGDGDTLDIITGEYIPIPRKYFITVDGKVCSDWIGAWDEEGMKSIGNLFDTEEQAIVALYRLQQLVKEKK